MSAESPVAGRLCDVRAVTGRAPDTGGVRWKLTEPARQLDANVVHLPAGRAVDTHAEPELDVLFLVVGGSGVLTTEEGEQELAEGALCWLPRGAVRRLSAGPGGLSYLTVHRRRPGMRIGSAPGT